MKAKQEEILSMNSLQIGYGSGKNRKVLLPPLSATACRGELVAVIGRNGIGKSTLLRTIIGLQQYLGGSVRIKGENLSMIPRMELARRIGYISTEIIRVNNMTVRDLVALGRFPHTNWIGKIDRDGHEAVEMAIIKTGMGNLAGRYIGELSDGERQRAMIARVLAQDTQILVMDEPTAFLDVMSRHEIVNLMLNLAGEGKTIIFSTHDLNIAISQASKIWLILEDNLTEGAPEDLIINKSFEKLFNTLEVGFNSEEAVFQIRRTPGRQISLRGEGMIRHWTEKALMRAGFSVSDRLFLPAIKAPAEIAGKWILETESGIEYYNSIYTLICSVMDQN